jgi:predicted Zn-dependent protease
MRWMLISLTLLCMLPGWAWADDYLCEENRSLADIASQRWYPEEFPLKVYIPPVPFPSSQPQMYVPLIQEAFATWARPFPALKFQYVDRPDAADIVIEWQEYFKKGVWGEAFLPILYQDAHGRMRHHSTVYLAINAQPGSGMSLDKPVPFSYIELLAIAKHEIGHSLGLGHSKGDGDLMGPQGYGFFSNSIFAASPRDIQTLLRLYRLPRKLKQHPCQNKG